MADPYKYIDASGLILPDTSELLAEVEGEFKAAFGQDLVITPESPEGILIAAETEARDSVVRNNAELANQINPHYAGGVFLDAIAALTGLERDEAQPSLVKARLTGVPGSIIPAGARAATRAGDVFFSLANLVLDNSGSGEAEFQSEQLGAIPAPIGSLTEILDGGELGWETISNSAPATLGRERESDTLFRKRREDTLFLQGVALPGAIMSAVMDVPGVRGMAFRENYSDEEQVIDGVTMPPHSIYCVVDGGTDADVARALLKNKSLGCNWKGSVEVQVLDEVSGQLYTVRFDRPEYYPARARLTVRVLSSVTIDAQSIVRQAIADYAADQLDGLRGFGVGMAVSPFEMAIAVGMVEPSIFVIKAEVGPFSAAPDELATKTIHLEIWQKATITQASIDVVVA
ncbi:baseplate J/gp47 family protein [Desulfovibrio sp. OttesenSCG-928-C14]|nr:baseplate J/gp47 family protein [Desulfovibrio sp. OttesenSCG-928-C14]